MSKTNYIGVKFSHRIQRFCATITIKGELHNCGSHREERQAAKLRDLAILRFNLSQKKITSLKTYNER